MSNSLYLKHYGVKGMKWGVRRKRIKSGKADITLDRHRYNRFNKEARSADILADGKRIGTAYIDEDKKTKETYISLIEVGKKYRSKGYGTKAISQISEDAKKRGQKYVTLMVDNDNPKARKLYDRIGFKVDHEDKEDWGVTTMRKKL